MSDTGIISAGPGSQTTWRNEFSEARIARVWGNTGYGGSIRMQGFTFLHASSVPYDTHPGNTNGDYLVAPGATIITTGGKWGVYGGIMFQPLSECDCECEPVEVLVTSLGPQVDDLRVRVNNTVVFDARCNSGWYSGEVDDRGNPAFNLLAQTQGFRIARITRAMVHAQGCRILPNSVISVDVFNGWGGGWVTSPWCADVTWSNGFVRSFQGGWSSSGPSIFPAPPEPTALNSFVGYLDASTFFSRYTIWDWDSCILGGYSGCMEAGYLVDGHTTWEAVGEGLAVVVEATGSYATYPGYTLGTVWNLADVNRLAGVVVSNTRRNHNIYNSGCGNADGTKIWGELSVPLIYDYYTTGPHFETYIEDGSFTVPCPPRSEGGSTMEVLAYG